MDRQPPCGSGIPNPCSQFDYSQFEMDVPLPTYSREINIEEDFGIPRRPDNSYSELEGLFGEPVSCAPSYLNAAMLEDDPSKPPLSSHRTLPLADQVERKSQQLKLYEALPYQDPKRTIGRMMRTPERPTCPSGQAVPGHPASPGPEWETFHEGQPTASTPKPALPCWATAMNRSSGVMEVPSTPRRPNLEGVRRSIFPVRPTVDDLMRFSPPSYSTNPLLPVPRKPSMDLMEFSPPRQPAPMTLPAPCSQSPTIPQTPPSRQPSPSLGFSEFSPPLNYPPPVQKTCAPPQPPPQVKAPVYMQFSPPRAPQIKPPVYMEFSPPPRVQQVRRPVYMEFSPPRHSPLENYMEYSPPTRSLLPAEEYDYEPGEEYTAGASESMVEEQGGYYDASPEFVQEEMEHVPCNALASRTGRAQSPYSPHRGPAGSPRMHRGLRTPEEEMQRRSRFRRRLFQDDDELPETIQDQDVCYPEQPLCPAGRL